MKTTHGSKALKATLTECVWAASRKKNCYLKAKYHSLIGRRGKKRTLIAVGHKLLVLAYHILKRQIPYQELGVDYLDKRRKEKIMKSHVNRLMAIGYEVTLKEAA